MSSCFCLFCSHSAHRGVNKDVKNVTIILRENCCYSAYKYLHAHATYVDVVTVLFIQISPILNIVIPVPVYEVLTSDLLRVKLLFPESICLPVIDCCKI